MREQRISELVRLCKQIESEVAFEYVLNSARRAAADRPRLRPSLSLVPRSTRLPGVELRAVGG